MTLRVKCTNNGIETVHWQDSSPTLILETVHNRYEDSLPTLEDSTYGIFYYGLFK